MVRNFAQSEQKLCCLSSLYGISRLVLRLDLSDASSAGNFEHSKHVKINE